MTLELVPWRGARVPVLSVGEVVTRFTTQDYINYLTSNQYYMGPPAPVTTYGYRPAEPISNSFEGFVQGMLYTDGPVASAEAYRLRVFGQAPLLYQDIDDTGRPGDLFDDPSLDGLRKPWPGGNLGDLMKRVLIYGDLAGNGFILDLEDELVLVRPDWVEIVLEKRMHRGGQLGWRQVGIIYHQGGVRGDGNGVAFLPGEYAHFVPGLPDPLATYRGMSWLTPLVREVQAGKAANDHKLAYFENAAPQPLTARILTPSGWSTMGEMRPGSEVVGVDGKPRRVTAVYPQGEHDIYRVRFRDRTSTECTLDHVWTVSSNQDRKSDATREMTLAQILAGGFFYRSGPAKWSVPMVDPVEYHEAEDLPLDPYLLGVLLGDGSFRGNGKGSGGVSLSAATFDADETIQTLEPMLPAGVTFSRRLRRNHLGEVVEFYFRQTQIGWHTANPLTQIIKGLGLWDVLGDDKFIPMRYLHASVKDRVSMLQGLIDTDGHVGKTATIFTTTSTRLAADLQTLVGSLGGVATIRPNKGRRTLSVTVCQLPAWIVPVRLLRKARAYHVGNSCRVRTMVGAEFVRRGHVQCIAVDSPEQLYVTDEFIVTHNSPNLSVALPKEITPTQFDEFVTKMDAQHKGPQNAGRTLYTAGGADVTVIGSNMQQMDFSSVQGKSETRVANAAGVPPVLLSFSEGMQGSSLNAGNYTAAKRNFVDTTMRDLWQNFACSVQAMDAFKPPKDRSRLWYDARDIPFLHEDAKDQAEITKTQVLAVEAGMRAGFKPDPMVQAVRHNNLDLLIGEHTGLFSVQMQAPKTGADLAAEAGTAPGEVPGAPPAEPVDFGALRADLVDEDDIERAVAEMFDGLDDEEIERFDPDQARIPGGHSGGGRWGSLITELLTSWAKGDGPDDPLGEHGFNKTQLRDKIAGLRKKAAAAGDHERVARLTPPRAKPGEKDEVVEARLKKILYTDVGAHVRAGRDEGKPSAKFTLQGKPAGSFDDRMARAATGDEALAAAAPRRGLSPAQTEAIDQYGIDTSFNINAALREGKGDVTKLRRPAKHGPIVESLDSAMEPLSSDVVVYRRLHGGHIFGDDELAGDLTGRTFTDHGYVSTSTSERRGSTMVVRVLAPKGTPAISGHGLEADEIVFGRGQRFRVVADHGKPGGTIRQIDVEVVPAGSSPRNLRNLDVAVYRDKDGKPALFEESDTGKRGPLVERFDSLDEMAKWAEENGEPRLAEWARKEGGGKAPAKEAKKAAPKALTGDAALAAAPIDFTKVHPDSGLTPDEEAVFADYVGDGAYGTNPTLRTYKGHTDPHDDETVGEVRLMDAAMSRSPLTADVLVERGISHGADEEMFGEKRWRGDLTGATMLDYGFQSTTTRLGGGLQYAEQEGAPFEQATLHLRVPAGTQAIKMSGADYEDELLLQRGLTIKVTSDTGYDDKGGRRIEAEIVGTPVAPRMMTGAEFDAMTPAQQRKRMRDAGFNKSTIDLVVGSPSPRKSTTPTPTPEPASLDSLRNLNDPEAIRDELDLRKVDELKALLREQGLPVSGRKRDLVDRLTGHLGGGGTPKAPAKAAPSAKAGGRAPAPPVPIHDLFEADDATVETALKDVFEGQFGPYTTKATVSVTRAGTRVDKRGREHKVEPAISIGGKIYDEQGHEIGYFGQDISSSTMHYGYQDAEHPGVARREVWANIGIVQLGEGDYDDNPTKYHGKGFGREFDRRVFEFYRNSGVHGITLHDHNGYVWAARGFDWANGMPDYKQDEMRELIDNLRAGRTKNKHGEVIPKALREAPDLAGQLAAAEDLLERARTLKPGEPGYPTAYELSQLGRRQGQRGKSALWFGKVLRVHADHMILNPDEGEIISP